MINYHNKKFKVISNSSNGELDSTTVFHYQQKDQVVFCSYSCNDIVLGQLLGTVDEKGIITMIYQQINQEKKLKTGKCISEPQLLANGKIRLLEKWEWTSADFSKGKSILEEL